MPGEPGYGTPEAEAWDMPERVNLFLIQCRGDLAQGVLIEHELFLGMIRNWHSLSREVEEMLRDRACSRRNDRRAAPTDAASPPCRWAERTTMAVTAHLRTAPMTLSPGLLSWSDSSLVREGQRAGC